METITLHDIHGTSILSGTDSGGSQWVQFTVDYFADQLDGECCICSAILESGWLCLDGAEEVCDSHVEFAP